jgi:hypothetical protein
MAKPEHLAVLKRGKGAWNAFRVATRKKVTPDLQRSDLQGMLLRGFDFSGANLYSANLQRCTLTGADFDSAFLEDADLSSADLSGAFLGHAHLARCDMRGTIAKDTNFTNADLRECNLREANLQRACLERAVLRGCDLWRANLSRANLRGTNLKLASLVSCNLSKADMTGALVYGASVWSTYLKDTKQDGLVITRRGQTRISVDSLETAQLLFLLIENQSLRSVIDALTTKVVLILGRFTPIRKAVLDEIRCTLRAVGLTPVIFDFDGPQSRDLTETIRTIAHLSRFIIADISDPKSIPQELMAVVPNLPSVPVLPIISSKEREYAMFPHLSRFPWVLGLVRYDSGSEIAARIVDTYIPQVDARLGH